MNKVKYNYEKLKQPAVLNMMDMYFGTREMDILPGNMLSTIRLGNGIMFVIENGELRYFSGLPGYKAVEIGRLAKLMEKMQSVITLECPVFNEGNAENEN